MNIINEFFVSFILIKLYFKFKVCRKIKFPLLWKFYFSKWKFYFSADTKIQALEENINGVVYLRLIRPLIADESCVTCHEMLMQEV